jgi:hypothetical protein
MNEQMNIIKDYLEKSYSGAKMMPQPPKGE